MSDFESGAFNRALPTLRFKPLRLNHLQCSDKTECSRVDAKQAPELWEALLDSAASDVDWTAFPVGYRVES